MPRDFEIDPCPIDFQMPADQKRGFCESCRKTVHNLDLLTDEEFEALGDGEVCVQRSKPTRWMAIAAAVMAMFAGSATARGAGAAAEPSGTTILEWMSRLVGLQRIQAGGIQPERRARDWRDDYRSYRNSSAEPMTVQCGAQIEIVEPWSDGGTAVASGTKCQVAGTSYVWAAPFVTCHHRGERLVCRGMD